MTWEKIKNLIAAGYGQGHFSDYKPWLRVTKRDYSPTSTIGHHPSIAQGRLHHYRSLGEYALILVLKWLGAVDVRDQFPVWPWEHDHPGAGLPGFEKPPRLRGLVSIAKDAGVEHGAYPGTNIPYIATIDILSTWRRTDQSYYLLAHECKPFGKVYVPNLLDPTKERLVLTRRYCLEANIPNQLAHPETLNKELIRNLEA